MEILVALGTAVLSLAEHIMSTLKGLDATRAFHSLPAWFGKKLAATNCARKVQLGLYVHGARNQSAVLCLETSPALRIRTLFGEGSWQ